jgi:alpha-beta hydrolase superfamily lysophospholipase
VVGYDQRGHGRSEGARGAIKKHDDLLCDLASVIDNLKTAYPHERLALLGHSLGGLIAARFAAALASPVENVQWRRSIDLCLLSSPALKIPLTGIQKFLLKTVGRLTPDFAVNNGLNPNWINTDPLVVQAYRNDSLVHDRVTGRLTRFMLESIEVVRQRANHWTIPTLLLYSGADRCVSPSGSRQFAANLPAAMIHTKEYKHMAHEIFNEPDRAEVLIEMESWLSSA